MYRKAFSLVVLLIISISVAYYFAASNVGDVNSKVAVDVDKTFNLTCPLQARACVLHLANDLTLTFNLQPKGLPVLQPLALSISSNADQLEKLTRLHAWFEGRDMDMGQHFFRFDESPMNDRLIEGKGMIPICTIDTTMIWRFITQFDYLGERIEVGFDLQSQSAHSY